MYFFNFIFLHDNESDNTLFTVLNNYTNMHLYTSMFYLLRNKITNAEICYLMNKQFGRKNARLKHDFPQYHLC